MMTIDEAIAELTKIQGKWQFSASNSRDSALQLGIEASIAWKRGREKHGWFYYPLLPGETED